MKYVALLRGVNVGGKTMVKMNDLTQLFISLGFTKVKTVINSGNVIFEATETNEQGVREKIEKKLEKILGWHIAVLLRSSDEIKEILRNNPFTAKELEENTCQITFLSQAPTDKLQKLFLALQNDNEKFVFTKREIYSLLSSVRDAKIFNTLGKKLEVFATSRSIKTIERIAAL